jgi:hypothetical protein
MNTTKLLKLSRYAFLTSFDAFLLAFMVTGVYVVLLNGTADNAPLWFKFLMDGLADTAAFLAVVGLASVLLAGCVKCFSWFNW